MTTTTAPTVADLHAERDRLITELSQVVRQITESSFTHPPDPTWPACDGTGMVGRCGGLSVCTCTRRVRPGAGRYGRAKVRGDAR